MEKLLKIGEVSELCDVSIKTLRYWEEEGLIEPAEVDIYTGYRRYSKQNVAQIRKIQFLRDNGFSIKEIKNFDSKAIKNKIMEFKREIKSIKSKIETISSLAKQKGEIIMKPFISDQNAIGKWEYVESSASYETLKKGDTFKDKDVLTKNLYFLPNGEGYWIFDRWTKGELYQYEGNVWKYEIVGNKMIIGVIFDNELEYVLVYKKVDSKEYTKEEIKIKDDTNKEFVKDNRVVGFWKSVDWVSVKKLKEYQPTEDKNEELYMKSLSFAPNGELNFECEGNKFGKIAYTKGFIIDKASSKVSKYTIKKFGSETYLLVEWKSGDYTYGGRVWGWYVYKKLK